MQIDSDTKRRQAEKIRKELTKGLSQLGFTRLRTTSWIREREHIVQRIHLHLFSCDTSFRVHLAVHVKDCGAETELNGISSYDGWYSESPGWLKKPRKYVFHFNRLDPSVEKCASELLLYCKEVAAPWFGKYSDVEQLLCDAASPLNDEEKLALRSRLAA